MNADVEVLDRAVTALLDRRSGREVPEGRTDRAGRWHPVESEKAACCKRVSSSLTWDAAARRHCVSARHVAALHGVDPADLAEAAKKRDLNPVSTDVDAAATGGNR